MQTTGQPAAGDSRLCATLWVLMGCAAQLDTRVMSYIKRIEPRRVGMPLDVETGLVFGLSQFRHPWMEKTLKIVGVPGVDSVDMSFSSRSISLPPTSAKSVAARFTRSKSLGFTMP